MICPVCLFTITTTDGVVDAHRDSLGVKSCPMSGREPFVWDERSTRRAVRGRSGDICERCLGQRATEMHHRKSRGVGGQWTPAVVIHLCHGCHRWVTENPKEAHRRGLRCKSHENPQVCPVIRDDGTVFQPSDEVSP